MLIVMILVQSITICVWRGDVGILLVYLIGRIILNFLLALPGIIFECCVVFVGKSRVTDTTS
jgi:hypothetical protein